MLKVRWAFICFFLVCLFSGIISFGGGFGFAVPNPSWAQEPYKEIRGTEDGLIIKCEMYVMSKTEEGVIISEKLFRVLPSTVILNDTGKKITLRELQVPSLAFIEYSMKTDNSPPTIVSLQLLTGSQKSLKEKRGFGRSRRIKLY